MSGQVTVRLPLAGRQVVVVEQAPAPLVGALLDCRARVRVVTEQVSTSVQDLHERGLLQWQPRAWEPADLSAADLVVSADPSPALQEHCRQARRWCVAAADLNVELRPAGAGPHRTDPHRADPHRAAAADGAEDEARIPAPSPSAPVAPTSGEVLLVGGGPGDPGLLTAAALAALARAEVVVHDRLAPLGALPEVAAHAQWIDVGKIPRGRTTAQEQINALLIQHARQGRVVVRLKGGDAFVFGRGGEEAQACAAQGIPVRVIPGISSALAAPALAGVPLTHRGLSQGFSVLSGHLAPDDPGCTLDYRALARSGTTLVFLMAVAQLPDICAALIEGGLPPQTPAVTVADAALPTQRVVRARLAELAAAVSAAGLGAPAVTVIGEVAGLDLGLVSPGQNQPMEPLAAELCS